MVTILRLLYHLVKDLSLQRKVQLVHRIKQYGLSR